MFTAETRIGAIVGQPEFKGREYMTGKFPGIGGVFTGLMPLKTLARLVGTWNPHSMADGMNHLYERAKAGTVFYDIYSDEELASDPSRRLTGIAAFPVERRSKFVVVCAGGGYASVCSMVEAYPVIKTLNEMGYAAFSMQYRCGKDAKAPHPMEDLAHAVRFILDHADELHVEKEDYAVMGFSAGGHLAASFGTQRLGYARYGLPAPAALILSYPVVTMGEKTHAGSKANLIGKSADSAAIEAYSIEMQVGEAYPPSFVWQFDHDNMVPVENTQMLVSALESHGVAHEYHTYPGTIHGAGLGIGTPSEGWLDDAVSFWQKCC